MHTGSAVERGENWFGAAVGVEYRFCSLACAQAFAAEPERLVRNKPAFFF